MNAPSGVSLTIDGGIARLTLDRPERLNALDARMHAGLRDALDSVAIASDVRVLVLTGTGRAFCSGQDLSERAQALAVGEVDLARSVGENYNPLVRRLMSLPMPVIASVNGTAAGAGVALALLADIVLAARSATFQLAFARVGLGTDCGLSWLLPRLIGAARARALALTAEPITAQQAESWGLVWRALDDEALTSETETLARRLASGPQAALRAIKKRMSVPALEETLDTVLEAERQAQGVLGLHPDYREVVTAFVAKRKPAFRGR